jgi:hypothetical protein
MRRIEGTNLRPLTLWRKGNKTGHDMRSPESVKSWTVPSPLG